MAPIALADCNNFYVSCERVNDARLHNRPVVVLSNNDGCIIARSEEAKVLGIKMGEPFHLRKAFLERHHVAYLSSNYSLYSEMSERVMACLADFATRFEHYSIDEAFLQIVTSQPLDVYARRIREAVWQKTGIPVSIGVAETKTLAKVANYHAKRSPRTQGVLNLTGSRWQDEALARMSVTDVWGVGWRWGEKLKRLGIATALDLKRADGKDILRRYGIVLARTVAELNGQSCLPILEAPPASKLIMSSMSFGRPVTELSELREAVSTYAAHSAARMRRERLAARTIFVFIQTNPYSNRPQYSDQIYVRLPMASFDTGTLIRSALTGLETIFVPGYQYHKAGVMLQELVPQDAIQLSLFLKADLPRQDRLMRAHDAINKTHGPGALRYASEGFRHGWAARRAFLSDRNSALPELEVCKEERGRISTVQFTATLKLLESIE